MDKIKKLIQPNLGFTLVESLLVLFCLTVFIVLSFTFFRLFGPVAHYDEVFDKLVMSMLECQTLAKATEQRTRIIVSNKNEVILRYKDGEEINRWSLPVGMTMTIQTVGNTIEYTENGTISRPGTIDIESPYYKKTYSINFTYGRLTTNE